MLWAISPEGRADNLGEVIVEGSKSKLDVTAQLQAFALIVTSEPYFAVTRPSEVVVVENIVRADTIGSVEEIEAKFDLLQRSQYTLVQANAQPASDPRIPLAIQEARNAMQIAKAAGAEHYAADSLQKASQLLQQAEEALAHKSDKKQLEMAAREAVQTAEDARAIAAKRTEDEIVAKERQAAADREARAKTQAEEAEKAKLEAQLATERAAREKAEAEAARLAAQAQQQAAQADAQLLSQLSAILQTQDSARGLIVNMSDVLFDTGSYTLKAGAREKLAKISGILLAHPGLTMQVEGHTDSLGSDDFNQQLSERRSGMVRDFLVDQGVAASTISARGFGKTQPVASNDTVEGRQRNRRVELVVNGDSIDAATNPRAASQ